MRFLDVVIDGLATHRITRLVTEDKVTEDIRDYLIENYPPQEHKLGYFVTCPHCVSVWAAGAVAVMEMLARSESTSRPSTMVRCTVGVLRYTLALSGAVSLGHEVAGKLPTPL